MRRIQNYELPLDWNECPYTECIYNEDGICPEPRINKGNSDSKCHSISNKKLLEILRQQKDAADLLCLEADREMISDDAFFFDGDVGNK